MTTYPSVANLRPAVALTLPLTVTVPAALPNTRVPSAAWLEAPCCPAAEAQLALPVDQVPPPPPPAAGAQKWLPAAAAKNWTSPNVALPCQPALFPVFSEIRHCVALTVANVLSRNSVWPEPGTDCHETSDFQPVPSW
ncbi:MAG: hypothetical protein ACKOSQ_03895 [Planctomycetaceae bacterium]